MVINNKNLQALAENLWMEYCMVFPRLVKFDCPKIFINNRFTSTGGINYSEENRVELAGKFFVNNEFTMLTVILPHELAHQIDYNLNGWIKGAKHHRNSWKDIMIKIGQEPNRCHTMDL